MQSSLPTSQPYPYVTPETNNKSDQLTTTPVQSLSDPVAQIVASLSETAKHHGYHVHMLSLAPVTQHAAAPTPTVIVNPPDPTNNSDPLPPQATSNNTNTPTHPQFQHPFLFQPPQPSHQVHTAAPTYLPTPYHLPSYYPPPYYIPQTNPNSGNTIALPNTSHAIAANIGPSPPALQHVNNSNQSIPPTNDNTANPPVINSTTNSESNNNSSGSNNNNDQSSSENNKNGIISKPEDTANPPTNSAISSSSAFPSGTNVPISSMAFASIQRPAFFWPTVPFSAQATQHINGANTAASMLSSAPIDPAIAAAATAAGMPTFLAPASNSAPLASGTGLTTNGSNGSAQHPQQQQQQSQPQQTQAQKAQQQHSPSSGRPSSSTNTKQFICPRCNTSFKTNSNMQKHVRTVHDNSRPFKCDKCDARYGHKNLLVEHIRTAHDHERPFVCPTCNARFGRSSNLYSHMKSHDPKREHTCGTCHVAFSLHGNMVKHIKTVHLKQRPFHCSICGARFGLRSDLTRHMKNVHGIQPAEANRASRTGVNSGSGNLSSPAAGAISGSSSGPGSSVANASAAAVDGTSAATDMVTGQPESVNDTNGTMLVDRVESSEVR